MIPHFRSETWEFSLCGSTSAIVDNFVGSNQKYFQTALNVEERWDRLGEDKDTSVEVDVDCFRLHFASALEATEIVERNVFYAAHLAYAIATGFDPLKSKLLFYHAHTPSALLEIQKVLDFDEIILMVRNPSNGISRMQLAIDESKRYDLNQLGQVVSHVLGDIDRFPTFRQKFRILAFENLHESPEDTLNDICREWDISYSRSLMNSTYWGLQWWGDTGSVQLLKGFNANPRRSLLGDLMSRLDAYVLEGLLWPRILEYAIWRTESRNSSPSRTELFVLRLFARLPMKVEWIALREAIHKKSWKTLRILTGRIRLRQLELIETSRKVYDPNYCWPLTYGRKS